ncbi:MAG: AraC family transcriptional regulator [Clostridia bacterium]|nr:AraC family transcriptional regulator [Clostridia bacterium]
MSNASENKYTKSSLSSVFTVKGVFTVHYFKYGQKFEFEGEKHPFWELVYIDAGEVAISADEKTFTLCQGEAYFHKPNEHHTISTNNRFANSVIVSFDCNSPYMSAFNGLKLTLSAEQKGLIRLIVSETAHSFSDKLDDVYLTKMQKSENQPFGSEQLIKLGIEQLLISCYRSHTLDLANDKKSRGGEDLTSRVIEILQDNIFGSVSLDDISRALFFSKTYIKSAFKKTTGQTVMQYFAFLKAEEAKKLISTGKFTFTEIADKLGYSSLYYFSRQFKKTTSLSPSQYAGSIKVDYLL